MRHKEISHKMRILECKFFSEGNCRDGLEECIYSHDTNKPEKGFQQRSDAKERNKCETENCRDQRCKLSHFRIGKSETPCRFATQCNRQDCEFKHEKNIQIKSHMKGFQITQRKKASK